MDVWYDGNFKLAKQMTEILAFYLEFLLLVI